MMSGQELEEERGAWEQELSCKKTGIVKSSTIVDRVGGKAGIGFLIIQKWSTFFQTLSVKY